MKCVICVFALHKKKSHDHDRQKFLGRNKSLTEVAADIYLVS